jgi:hypothetical protein
MQQGVNIIDKHQRPPDGGAFEAGGRMRFTAL